MSDYPTCSYPFYERTVELRQQDITATGAAVIVNSIGIKATFKRGGVAQVILTAAGDGAKEMVVHYTGSWVTSRLWQRQSQAKVAGIGRSQIQKLTSQT